MNIYELTDEMCQLLAAAEEGDIDPQVLADTLEGVESEFEAKADGYARVRASIKAEIDGIDKEIERLNAMKKTRKNNLDRIDTALETAMIKTGKTKFKTQLFSFGIQKNPPKTEILDEENIPAEFWIVQAPTIDKTAVKDYLKANGDQKWARLVQTESLRIR